MTAAGAETVVSSLLDIVGQGHARPAGPADAVDGAVPAAVAEPGSVEEAGRCLELAAARGLKVLARGGGTKCGWGLPPTGLDLVLSTVRLDRVLEHAAGDLVVRAQAGARLADVQDALGAAGQWLGLDPPAAGATLGGIVAANAFGPRRLRYGTVRDLLIGITVVRADGTVARAGGKVVKNVAGYDLGKLFTGSFGTLGVIVEVTFRLHPRPAERRVLRLDVATPEAAGAAVQSVVHSALVPSAVELDWREGRGRLDVLFEGGPRAVAAQAAAAAALLGAQGTPAESAWATPSIGDGDAELAIATLPAELPAVIRAVAEAAGPLAPRLWGQAAVGALSLALGGDEDAQAEAIAALRRALAPRGGRVVVRRASPALKRRADVWGPPGDALKLMRRVKRQFDPQGTLSPGRFVGGI
jgi:glycolate dehydrogenase FAD-binding subunit